jgi:type I restriction enzyme S subunit
MSELVFESEIGTFPSHWRVERVDKLFTIQQGKQVSKRTRRGDNQRPFLRTKNVYWCRLDLGELDHLHFSVQDEIRLELLPNDLLVCEGGDVGRTALWNGEVERCYFQNHLHRLRVINADEVLAEFGMYWFWYAFELGKVYFGRGNKTTIPNLSKSRLGELQIPCPPIDEQEKIVLFLSNLQRSADLHEAIYKDRRELQESLTSKIISAQIDISGLNLDLLKIKNEG